MDSNLTYLIREELQKDNMTFFFRGEFDDKLTGSIIQLGKYAPDVAEDHAMNKRMSFLIAESFQNIVRHGADVSTDNFFGIRDIYPYIHIYSHNKVSKEVSQGLEHKFKQLNQFSPEELKDYYRTILEEGQISEKGGAGLGLIEMARKSLSPIQYDFGKVENDVRDFHLQIDLLIDKEQRGKAKVKCAIQDNIDAQEEMLGENIIMLFTGNFNEGSLLPILSLLNKNIDNNYEGFAFSNLFHVCVELLQNVSRYGAKMENNASVFALSINDRNFVVSTGNYIHDDTVDYLPNYLDTLSGKSKEELNSMYKDSLKKSARVEGNSAKVGLIDVARVAGAPFSYTVEKDNTGHYFTLSIEIKN